jgi:hypothetical protein
MDSKMNERLNEFAMKANSHHNNFFDLNYKELDVFLEKFAELIVKECAIIANKAENTETETRCMYDVITEHFGVEE